MNIIKRITAAAVSTAVAVSAADIVTYKAQAENPGLIIDLSAIEAQPDKQFYFSDENEFFIDGIKAMYNGKNVTSDVNFTFNTTPESTFNGRDHDYKVPFIAEYTDENGVSAGASASMDVKIGIRGDANCDNKVDKNDVLLIENDLYMEHISGKSALSANGGLGIFLANADGRQKKTSKGAFGVNDLNVADAFFISSYLNSGEKGTLYDHILLKNASRPSQGTIALTKDAMGTGGDLVTVYAYAAGTVGFGAFDFTCSWEGDSLDLISVSSCSKDVTVFSALADGKLRIWGFADKGFIESGNIAELTFEIPENAEHGRNLLSIDRIDYFGSGDNRSDVVLSEDGYVTVSDISSGIRSNILYPVLDQRTDYDYGVKVWDAVADHDAKSVELPLILLGGLQTKGFDLTLDVPEELSVSTLPGAVTFSAKDGQIKGVYESSTPILPDFDTITVNIPQGTKPGRYYIAVSVSDIEGIDENADIAQLGGYVTIKEKPILFGDANLDGNVNIRDAAYIASMLSKGSGEKLPKAADYNKDGINNIRDAAGIAKMLAKKK